MNIYLDFETYWTSAEYSLGKMTTEAYVRDPRFEAQCVGIAIDDGPAVSVAGPNIKRVLDRVPWSEATVVAHNAAFDVSILSLRYGHRPGRIACTRSMAALLFPPSQSCSLGPLAKVLKLPAKGALATDGLRYDDMVPSMREDLAAYNRRDVEICRALFGLLWKSTPEVERTVIDAVVRMASEPRIALAVPAEPPATALDAALLDDARYAALLQASGVQPPTRPTGAGGALAWAFGKEDAPYAALAGHESPQVRKLVAARAAAKRVRAGRKRRAELREAAGRGPWPVEMMYQGSRTGGITGGVRTIPRGSADRAALAAPVGSTMLVGDLSAIELRLFAHVAGEDELTQRLQDGENVYGQRANALYGQGAWNTKGDPAYIIGKQSILAAMYGMGADRFLAKCRTTWGLLDTTQEEARAAIAGFRDEYKQMAALWGKSEWLLRRMAGDDTGFKPWSAFPSILAARHRLVLPSGRQIWYEDVESTGWRFRYMTRSRKRGARMEEAYIHGPQMCQNLMNAMARDVTCLAIHRVKERTGYTPVWTNHDEVVYIVPTKQASTIAPALREAMTEEVPWAPGMPLEADVAWCANYGEAK